MAGGWKLFRAGGGCLSDGRNGSEDRDLEARPGRKDSALWVGGWMEAFSRAGRFEAIENLAGSVGQIHGVAGLSAEILEGGD